MSANNQKQESKSTIHLDGKRLKSEIKAAFAKARAEGLDRSEVLSKSALERDEYIRTQLETFNADLVRWCITNSVIEAKETSIGHYQITDQGYLEEATAGALGVVGAGLLASGVTVTTTSVAGGVGGWLAWIWGGTAAVTTTTTAVSAAGVAAFAAPIVLGAGAIAYFRKKKNDETFQEAKVVFNSQLNELERSYLRIIDKTIRKKIES